MHEYYHSKGVTDLDAIRKEAHGRLTDSRWPEESLIHLHPAFESCDLYRHEEIKFPGQKAATAEEQGTIIPARTLQVGDEIRIDTWNDQEQDGPLL